MIEQIGHVPHPVVTNETVTPTPVIEEEEEDTDTGDTDEVQE